MPETNTVKWTRSIHSHTGSICYYARGSGADWRRIVRVDSSYRSRHGLPGWARYVVHGWDSQFCQLSQSEHVYETLREAKDREGRRLAIWARP